MPLEITSWAALWFLPFVTPVCLWVMWSDLKAMRIPNTSVLTLAGIFVIVGLWAVTIPLVFYTLLPVLRNTMVGIQQVDRSLIDAGRGIGMSARGVLMRVELPLAVPLILAGLRTALVLAVGTATLAFFVNGGGLGELIDTGYKLQLNSVMYVGAVLAIGLALLVDWLGGVAERWLAPKGAE